MPSKATSTAVARREPAYGPSTAQLAKVERERNTAVESAARSAAKRREADAAVDEEKRARRKAIAELVKQYAILFVTSALALTGGLVVGGQLTRVQDDEGNPSKYVGWGQWGSFAVGIIALVMARKPWHYAVAFLLLGVGGVKISDVSRQTDLIPGTYDWEAQIPEGATVIKVVPGPKAK